MTSALELSDELFKVWKALQRSTVYTREFTWSDKPYRCYEVFCHLDSLMYRLKYSTEHITTNIVQIRDAGYFLVGTKHLIDLKLTKVPDLMLAGLLLEDTKDEYAYNQWEWGYRDKLFWDKHKRKDNSIPERTGVYLLSASNGLYKIGYTGNLPARLERFTTMPEKVDLVHFIKTQDARKIESVLHSVFYMKRVRGEWFKLSERDVNYIKTLSGDSQSLTRDIYGYDPRTPATMADVIAAMTEDGDGR